MAVRRRAEKGSAGASCWAAARSRRPRCVGHETVPHQGLHDALAAARAPPPSGDARTRRPHGFGHAAAHAASRGREVDHRANGFDPTEILRDFDYGKTTRLASGRVLREWELVAHDKEIEVAPGVKYAAWTYNGRVPGPTLRCPRGRAAADPFRQRLRAPAHDALPRHPPGADGRHAGDRREPRRRADRARGSPSPTSSRPSRSACTSTTAMSRRSPPTSPTGSTAPSSSTRSRGAPEADELVMVMNGFDTNFDRSNEVYAVNTVGFHYVNEPIRVGRDELVRDLPGQRARVRPAQLVPRPRQLLPLLPDRHLAGADRVHRHRDPGAGPARDPRAALPLRGDYMFHAHVSEFAELGWTGFFEVGDASRLSARRRGATRAALGGHGSPA